MNNIEINPQDLVITQFRTDKNPWINCGYKGIRIKHIHTGKVFESGSERSQHANRVKCFDMLKKWVVENYTDYVESKSDVDQNLPAKQSVPFFGMSFDYSAFRQNFDKCMIDRCNYISENEIHYQRKFENDKFSSWKRL